MTIPFFASTAITIAKIVKIWIMLEIWVSSILNKNGKRSNHFVYINTTIYPNELYPGVHKTFNRLFLLKFPDIAQINGKHLLCLMMQRDAIYGKRLFVPQNLLRKIPHFTKFRITSVRYPYWMCFTKVKHLKTVWTNTLSEEASQSRPLKVVSRTCNRFYDSSYHLLIWIYWYQSL